MTLLNNITLRLLTSYPCYAVCYKKFGSPILAAKLETEIQNALTKGDTFGLAGSGRIELKLYPYIHIWNGRRKISQILHCPLTSAQNDTKMSVNRFRVAIDKTAKGCIIK